MSTPTLRFCLAPTLAAVLASAALAQSPVTALLTAADVEKVVGASGVTSVPRMSQPGAGGDLNFAGPDGKLLVMISVGNAQLYTKARQQKEMKMGGERIWHPVLAG